MRHAIWQQLIVAAAAAGVPIVVRLSWFCSVYRVRVEPGESLTTKPNPSKQEPKPLIVLLPFMFLFFFALLSSHCGLVVNRYIACQQQLFVLLTLPPNGMCIAWRGKHRSSSGACSSVAATHVTNLCGFFLTYVA